MPETSQPPGTKVTFLDQTGAKSVEAVVADSVTVNKILPSIITKMNLPMVGPDGQPMSYSCLLYTSPSPRDATLSRMPSSA